MRVEVPIIFVSAWRAHTHPVRHGGQSNVPVLHSEPRSASSSTGVFAPASSAAMELQRILRLSVPVIVKLAERKLGMSEVLRLGTGAIIEFSKRSDEPLELLINNKAVALGETVKVGENFGLRITQIGDVKQVIRSMGGHHHGG
jgi:flagellar motor switch protein FliN/FliY